MITWSPKGKIRLKSRIRTTSRNRTSIYVYPCFIAFVYFVKQNSEAVASCYDLSKEVTALRNEQQHSNTTNTEDPAPTSPSHTSPVLIPLRWQQMCYDSIYGFGCLHFGRHLGRNNIHSLPANIFSNLANLQILWVLKIREYVVVIESVAYRRSELIKLGEWDILIVRKYSGIPITQTFQGKFKKWFELSGVRVIEGKISKESDLKGNYYYMATIVRALWLAAERALFSCNDRALWKFFSARRFFEFWVKATSEAAKTTKNADKI